MLADSHIHLFKNGYKTSGEDEVSIYESLIEEYSIKCALVIGYEGEHWSLGNNAFIASIANSRPWMHPLAFLRPEELKVQRLEGLLSLGFKGISLYLSSDSDEKSLLAVDSTAWKWLGDHHWIISVNSNEGRWDPWLDVMKEFPKLYLLIAHLGSPSLIGRNFTKDAAREQLAPIKRLYEYQNVYLKLSGFYAFEPSHPIYPYPTLDKYLEYLFDDFVIDKLIWGSDFSPSIESVTFPETFEFLSKLPFLESRNLSKIVHLNLLNLLATIDKENTG